MDHNTFSKSTLQRMNFDSKYGSQWITNIHTLKNSQEYKIYATGDCDLQGRKYIALPANQKLTQGDKIKLNIM
jgi:hypothetical protein